jgi:hypothetical protein
MKRYFAASVVLMACQAGWAAQGLPVLKEGLWEVVVQNQQEPAPPPVKVLQCVDKKTSALMLLSPAPVQENCRAPKVKKSGSRYSVQTVCAVHDVKVNTTYLLSGDFSSRYSATFETRFASTEISQPPARKYEGNWQGPCKPGMKPADLELPNRITINLLDSAKKAAKAEQGHDHDHDHSAPGHKH